MSYNEIKKAKFTEIADTVIDGINRMSNDPFETITLVFHNMKCAQWFKAYYLKNSDRVMMNVNFITLSVFVNGLINPDGKFTIIGASELREYILKALLDSRIYVKDTVNPQNPINYIFDENGVNGINLYEFAGRLATLFMNYEYDNEDIGAFSGDGDKQWEKDLYERAIELAKKDNCYTSKSLFEKVKAEGSQITWSNGSVYVLDNSFMTELYKEIITKCTTDVTVYSLDESIEEGVAQPPIRVISAPSKLREVQAVHTEICKLIQSDPTLRLNDIVVYAPHIGDYANAIRRVFPYGDFPNRVYTETDENGNTVDRTTFPEFPTCILGEIREKQDMLNALAVLFDIANKRFFSVQDLNTFVNNSMVRYLKGIEDTDVKSWINALGNTNTYRNGKEIDDWKYLKRRLLLSMMVADNHTISDAVELAPGEEYLPYTAIGLDKRQINLLIDMIELLERWTELFTDELNAIELDHTKIEEIHDLLDKMFSRPGSDGEETNFMYREVSQEVDRIGVVFSTLPANVFMQLLKDAPNRFTSHSADMFMKGVTFLSLNIDDILPAKYVFVLGMSSNNFPRVDVKSELDYSNKHLEASEQDRKAFVNLRNGAENLTACYTCKDLKKDEDFFSSSVLGDCKPTTLPLDETRDYADLFSQKEFKDKAYYDRLMEGVGESENPELVPEENEPKAEEEGPENVTSGINGIGECDNRRDSRLRLKDLKAFFEDTYRYKFEHLLGKSYDDEDRIETEYEPFDVSKFSESNYVRVMAEKEAKDNLKKEMRLKHQLPEGNIGDLYFEKYFEEHAKESREKIDSENYVKKALPPLNLEAHDEQQKVYPWTLECDKPVYTRENGNTLYYLQPVDSTEKSVKAKRFFYIYVFSLMDVASRTDEGTSREYTISLWAKAEKTFSITSDKAGEMLNSLYLLMTDYGDTRYMSIKMMELKEDKLPKSIKGLKNNIEGSDGGPWQFFADSKMIEPLEAFGYSGDAEEFQKEIGEYLKTIKELVLFLTQPQEATE